MSNKVFELVPVLEDCQLSDKKCQIECVECSGSDFFLGTVNGFIIHYILEEKIDSSGKVVYKTNQTKEKYLDLKKSVKCIKAASALARILVLCDFNLVIINTENFEIIGGGSKLQGVSSFCINENPNVNNPFCIQICVGRKRVLNIFNIVDDKLNKVNTIEIPEEVVELCADGPHVCAGHLTQYSMFNFETNFSQKLFSFESHEHFKPVIRRIVKDEFLVSASEELGMFVTVAGISSRPPIQWSYPLLSVAYFHPHIIGLSQELVMIYSILDQQLKQTIPFCGGRSIGNFEGRIYVNSGNQVFCMYPIPWEKQIEDLLLNGKVAEALEFAENANHIGTTKDQFSHIFKQIQQRSALIYFSKAEFSKAEELFKLSRIDPREVISLFPSLLPHKSKFVRSSSLHKIGNLMDNSQLDDFHIEEAKHFLQSFLESIRNSDFASHLLEVDTVLIKLYSESNDEKLEPLILSADFLCDLKECYEWLERNKCYHALALLYRQSKENAKALNIWSQILSGKYQDKHFKGLQFFVECLSNEDDHKLVWNYAEQIFNINEEIGVEIFTRWRSDGPLLPDSFQPEFVLENLRKYPKAVEKYLEYLIFNQNIQDEKYHTELALLYVDMVLLSLKKENDLLLSHRKKLQRLLTVSNSYRAKLLLGKLENTPLYIETAIIYGKIEDHVKALNILVHNLKDHKAAEKYCIDNSQGKQNIIKNNLFSTLLTVYIKDLQMYGKNEFLGETLELLNTRAADFDACQVLKLVPGSFSVAEIKPFIRGSLRTSLHKYRMVKIKSALTKLSNLKTRVTLYEAQKECILLEESNLCEACKKRFLSTSFVMNPNGKKIHVACSMIDFHNSKERNTDTICSTTDNI